MSPIFFKIQYNIGNYETQQRVTIPYDVYIKYLEIKSTGYKQKETKNKIQNNNRK